MSSISALSNWRPAVRQQPAPALAGALSNVRGAAGLAGATGAAAPGSPASPSTVVKLSPEAMAAANEPVTTSSRFRNVGAAMLEQFKTGAAIAVSHEELPKVLDNQFRLSVTTQSGAQVELTLANVDDEMIFQVSSSAELNEAERKALASLAQGFQAAIDGMARGEPKIDLAALTRIDSKVLKSLDLHAEVKQGGQPPGTQSLDFRVDGTQRKVSLDGPSGKLDVSIDTSKLESLGTREQQEKAISGYLKQFDQAAQRGHGNLQLMTMFKDAFSDMSRTASRAEGVVFGLTTERRWALGQEDHAALTGLADFSASVTQAPKFSNPLRRAEADTFAYEVSQDTQLGGERRDDRTVAQTQKSHLTAQYHESLRKGGGEPVLDISPESQNYEYHQIDDRASSKVELAYKDAHLVKATLEQSASQSERVRKYMTGKLVSDISLPEEMTLVRDLMSSLAPYRAGENLDAREQPGEVLDERRRLSLDRLQDNMLMLSTPFELRARDEAW